MLKMENYRLILGHEPDQKTREACDRLNELAEQLHSESPELTQYEIWSIIEEAVIAVFAKRNQPQETATE